MGMTERERAIWSDAYKLMDRHADMEPTDEAWKAFIKDMSSVVEKHGDDYLCARLAADVFCYLERKTYKRLSEASKKYR